MSKCSWLNSQSLRPVVVGGVLGLIVYLGLTVFHDKGMSVGIDTQTIVKCLPYRSSILIPINNDAPSVGQLVSIHNENLDGEFRESSSNKLLKMVVGQSGDVITRKGQRIYVNNALVGAYPPTTPKGFKQFLTEEHSFVVPDDHLWAMGSYQFAADSRYVGAIPFDAVSETAVPFL